MARTTIKLVGKTKAILRLRPRLSNLTGYTRAQHASERSRSSRDREGTVMFDVRALQDAYNDAVAQGKKELARELLALWRDTLPERVAKYSPSTSRRRRN